MFPCLRVLLHHYSYVSLFLRIFTPPTLIFLCYRTPSFYVPLFLYHPVLMPPHHHNHLSSRLKISRVLWIISETLFRAIFKATIAKVVTSSSFPMILDTLVSSTRYVPVPLSPPSFPFVLFPLLSLFSFSLSLSPSRGSMYRRYFSLGQFCPKIEIAKPFKEWPVPS